MYAPTYTGGLTIRNATRRFHTSASTPTRNGASAAPNTIDTRLNAPKPAPRRCAGTASANPARNAGIAIVIAKIAISCSSSDRPLGTGR